MTIENHALWQRIGAHRFDLEEAGLPFSRRLARENGWSHAFALRAIEEYRRFCYLAIDSGHEVTPSDEVDQVWHLHLLYTRDYWDVFCPAVLGKPLHHGPTRGGAAEGRRYLDNYRHTLDAYQQSFGEKPPADLWPDERVRFGEAPHHRRVNTLRYMLLPRPHLPSLGHTAVAIVLVGVSTLFTGRPAMTLLTAETAEPSIPEQILAGIFLLLLLILFARLLGFGGGKKKNRHADSSGCTSCGTSGFSGRGGSRKDGDDNSGGSSDSHSGGDSGCGSSGCGGGGCGGGGD